jgi:hypothetical protein
MKSAVKNIWTISENLIMQYPEKEEGECRMVHTKRQNNDSLLEVSNNTCASIRGNTREASVIHRY